MSADVWLSARVRSRRPLLYTAPACADLDRPPFVRAASGIAWFEGKLAIVQDDASFIALVNPTDASVQAIPLPAGPNGRRTFEAALGNKAHKLDLECCFVSEHNGSATLFALGSGSTPQREQIVRVRAIPGGFDVRCVAAHAFYAALRACTRFSGSELNLEGAALRGDALVLFQRGNGAARGDLKPLNATCQVSLRELVRYLDDVDHAVPPAPDHVTQYELGYIHGVRLTFTDATQARGQDILFLASAEASPNSVDDGLVVGAAVGLLHEDGALEVALLHDEQGSLCRDKVEGIVLFPDDASRAFVVIDPDDATQPAHLLEVALAGVV